DAQGQAPLVTLRADKALDYGQVVSLMGELNAAGISQISLVTVAAGGGAGQARPVGARPVSAR
ncbi:MAG TPA: biopolymer transporter ExbD, partial [Novosphingobium sp.]|nr:biopolymer transporter ExbD [Novosphingobium sp.]